MKKFLFVLILVSGFTSATYAQFSVSKLKSTVNSASTAASASGIDVKTVSQNILTQLTSKLSLTDAQKPNVLSTVTGFLKAKSDILSLEATDKAQYSSKLSTLTSDLTTKFKGILTAQQMTKFLSLKSSNLSSTDVVSQLFK